MKKKIVNVALNTSGKVYSGGERAIVELVKQFEKKGYKQELYISYQDEETEITPSENLKIFYTFEGVHIGNKILVLLTYIVRFFRALFYFPTYEEEIILMSHADTWPDMLFSYYIKFLNPKVYWVAINHALVPESEYDTNPPHLRLYSLINERIFFLAQSKADLVVSVNENFLPKLSRKNNNTLIIKLGKEHFANYILKHEERDLDVCFLGRFFAHKGYLKIPLICEELYKLIPDDQKITFNLIGVIDKHAEQTKKKLLKFQDKIKVEFLGYMSGEKKFNLLARSKVMMFPSISESFGLVYLDAISVGTPVVEYDLACFNQHKKGVVKVPFDDNKEFAQKIFEILNNEKVFTRLSTEGFAFSKEFTWPKTGEAIIDKIGINLESENEKHL